MRARVLGAFWLICGASTMSAQGVPAQPPVKMSQAETVTSTVLKLEDSWASALVRRDRATFERLLAPKFIYTEDSVMMDRATLLEGIFSDVVTEAHNDSMVVHIFGNTAVVTGWLIVTGTSSGAPFRHRYRFTDVWMPRSGSWQIVAAQDYLMPAWAH